MADKDDSNLRKVALAAASEDDKSIMQRWSEKYPNKAKKDNPTVNDNLRELLLHQAHAGLAQEVNSLLGKGESKNGGLGKALTGVAENIAGAHLAGLGTKKYAGIEDGTSHTALSTGRENVDADNKWNGKPPGFIEDKPGYNELDHSERMAGIQKSIPAVVFRGDNDVPAKGEVVPSKPEMTKTDIGPERQREV